jgi:hypothetical protein
MENQITITCPHCGKTYTDYPLITDTITGEGDASRFMMCECGARLTFWAITTQLREQKSSAGGFASGLRPSLKGGAKGGRP